MNVAVFGGANSIGFEDNHDAVFANQLKRALFAQEGITALIDNFGSIHTGPNYAATCLQSILSSSQEPTAYDAIVLDFPHQAGSDANVLSLARRLRQRFPRAQILFLHYWRPLSIRRQIDLPHTTHHLTSSLNLLSWMYQNNFTDWESPQFHQALLQDVQGSNSNTPLWFDQHHVDGTYQALSDYAHQVNGEVVSIGDIHDSVVDGLIKFGHYFHRPALLSIDGHKAVANVILEALLHNLRNPRNTPVETNEAVLGDFGGGDLCRIWYANGQLDPAYSPYSPGRLHTGLTQLNDQYESVEDGSPMKTQKFVLEAKCSNSVHLKVTNPFPEPRRLFLSFMVSDTFGDYPRTQIAGGGVDIQVTPMGSSMSLAPHYIKTIPAGYFHPGTHTLNIAPKSEQAQYPFRLAGISFSNEHVIPDLYTFAPMFSR